MVSSGIFSVFKVFSLPLFELLLFILSRLLPKHSECHDGKEKRNNKWDLTIRKVTNFLVNLTLESNLAPVHNHGGF